MQILGSDVSGVGGKRPKNAGRSGAKVCVKKGSRSEGGGRLSARQKTLQPKHTGINKTTDRFGDERRRTQATTRDDGKRQETTGVGTVKKRAKAGKKDDKNGGKSGAKVGAGGYKNVDGSKGKIT
ncbi:hypothetical protein DFH07DRAFT_773640 [Mycena maculata]|uniref:Uncharacterized protein n=1 Tax=Mycena maculata TaxID=230809 RepID=A0AAD7NC69_9AGAR|nr:hypothetical protein DFH07DRAFT_773640 [Mycena maculata]